MRTSWSSLGVLRSRSNLRTAVAQRPAQFPRSRGWSGSGEAVWGMWKEGPGRPPWLTNPAGPPRAWRRCFNRLLLPLAQLNQPLRAIGDDVLGLHSTTESLQGKPGLELAAVDPALPFQLQDLFKGGEQSQRISTWAVQQYQSTPVATNILVLANNILRLVN